MQVAQRTQVRRATSATGMDHASWGDGARTLLFIGGGPGGNVPSGRLSRTTQRWFEPFTDAGYTVWYVSRRRGMPPGHTVEDIADDYGHFAHCELGGRVDLLVGVSFGGMVGQHLAARHGDVLGQVALVAAAAEVSDFGKDVDARLARAVERDEPAAVGATFAEYALRGRRWGWLRRLSGPLIGRALMSGTEYPTSDVAVEAQAELTFDARAALPGIRVPVVLLCGDEDPFFVKDVVEETARLIPTCTVAWYPGRGHLWVASSRKVPRDILAVVGPAEGRERAVS